jgi:hypothetical protein
MSLGNGNPKSGDKGSNFNYELKVLQGLQNIINNVLAGIDVTVVNPGGAGAVNIQDGGNSITVDGTVAVSSLPNEGQQSMANSISVAIASDQAGVQRTPTFLRPAGLSGTIPAGRYSMSFANVGTINATVGGITLKPGETMNFDAGAINNTLGSVAYSATGAGGELLIISIV